MRHKHLSLKMPAIMNRGLAYYTALFDQGSAGAIAAEDATHVRITPYQHWNSQWLWWAIKWNKLSGKTPHFLIAKANRFSTVAANENVAVWATAADTDTWYKFDNQSVGASDIEFYNNSPFPGGMIYMAYLPLYPWSRIVRKMGEWAAADARIVNTPSTTSFIISNATARSNNDGSGRTAPALPFYGFNLTNANSNTKNNMVLAARSHPNETQGSYALEGAMSWLLGGSAEAEFLLDWFNIFVYPCTNPQGVWGGYFRSEPEDKTKDHNRYWDVDTLECCHAFRTAIAADTGGVIELGFDFHGSADDSKVYGMITDHTAALAVIEEAKMQGYVATYTDQNSNIPQSFKAYLETSGAKFANGQEGGAHNAIGAADWKLYGQYAMRSIASMHADGRWTNGPGIGCRDFNGTTDRIDWAAIYDLAGHALTISAWIYSDGWAGNSDYILEIHAGGDAATGLSFYQYNASRIGLSKRGTGTTLYKGSSATGVLTGAWHHILVTHDGVDNDYTHIHIYFDGVEGTDDASPTNGSGIVAETGSWSVGGRIYDDTRNFDGKICQVGAWDRVLNATEIANLAAKYAPDLAAASGLLFYFKGNTSDLHDAVTNTLGVADGTTQVTGVGTGPSIIYA